MEQHSEYREEIIPHGDHPLSYDHAEPRYVSIAAFMGITVVLLIVIGIGIQVYYEIIYNNEEYARVISQENWQLRDLRNTEQWELTHYGYIDKNKGTVRLPIDQAMQLALQDAQQNKLPYPTNTYRVKTPEELAGGSPGVAQPGAAAANAAQNTGQVSSPQTSSPNAQPPAPPKH
jgi:hypothetical protein